MGFGVGENPTPGDAYVAKAGMAAIGYDPNNGYVEHDMFGSGFELHSVFGDLWAHCGLVGLVLAAYLFVFVVRGSPEVSPSRPFPPWSSTRGRR